MWLSTKNSQLLGILVPWALCFGLGIVGGAIALYTGLLGSRGFYLWGAFFVILFLAFLVIFRQYELVAIILIVIHLYVDFFLGFYFVATALSVALLFILYLLRSPSHLWVRLPASWLWILFLVLAIIPSIRGATDLYDTALYYPNIILGSLIIFWLGAILAQDTVRLRRLLKFLSFLGALVAIHTIVQYTTGTFLLSLASHRSFSQSATDFQLGGGNLANIHRVGSFFIDPDWDGAFLAMFLCISLGLFVEATSPLWKIIHFAQTLVFLPALLFTYSSGSWIATFVGIIVFIVFTGSTRYRLLLPLLILGVGILFFTLFPKELSIELQHSSGANELYLRLGVWETAIRVIESYPLTGVGLGHAVYLATSLAYTAPNEYITEDHPHNSYLELGAMGGLPLLCIFIALLVVILFWTVRNWIKADSSTRSLIGAGLAAVAVLSTNSITINAWTLPPISAVGWFILGAISSPLLAKVFDHQQLRKKNA